MSKTVAIIVAGGKGERMGGDVPKQYMLLAGKPIIVHTLEKFAQVEEVDHIVVVCDPHYKLTVEEFIESYGIKKPITFAAGGRTRQASSFNGLVNCPEGVETVLIHDSVRPFVTEKIIIDVIAATKEAGASAPAIPSADTIVLAEDDIISEIPERKNVRRIQTPQGFDYAQILQAHEKALASGITDATDDCGLIVDLGEPVKLVQGSDENFKITTKQDIDKAEYINKRG